MQVVSRVSMLPPAASVSPKEVKVKPAAVEPLAPPQQVEKSAGIWESAKFGFRDFLDMINPLQHLPVISTLYRKLTGDEIGDGSRVVGGALFGGITGSWISGLVSAVANVFVSRSTGKDIADHVIDVARSVTQQPTAPQPVSVTTPQPSHAIAEQVMVPEQHASAGHEEGASVRRAASIPPMPEAEAAQAALES